MFRVCVFEFRVQSRANTTNIVDLELLHDWSVEFRVSGLGLKI